MQNRPKTNRFEDQDEHNVFMSNSLVRTPRIPWVKLTLQENKLLRYFISRMPSKCDQFKLYEISMTEFLQACGASPCGKNYREALDAFMSLSDNEKYRKWLRQDNDDNRLFCFFNDPVVNPRTKKMTFRFSEYMFNLVANLKKQFTAYQICYILSLSSKYSLVMYELLQSYASLSGHRFDVDELKKILGAENYKNFKDFRNRCLDSACVEINSKTDLYISYTPIKAGRSVTAVDFRIKKKSYDELFELWGYKDNSKQNEDSIDRATAYEGDDQIPGQISLAI